MWRQRPQGIVQTPRYFHDPSPSLLALPAALDVGGQQNGLHVGEVGDVVKDGLRLACRQGLGRGLRILKVQQDASVKGRVGAVFDDLPALEAEGRPVLVRNGHVLVDVVVHVEELALLGLVVEDREDGRHVESGI